MVGTIATFANNWGPEITYCYTFRIKCERLINFVFGST